MATLFKVPIASGGTFDCTSPADRVYLLSFESPPDNRLTTAFNEAFLISLDLIDQKYPKGVVVTTSKIDKFYSNGLQLEDIGDPAFRSTFFAKSYYPLLLRLLTYPMPTVALLNGHTFAGGLILAMHHDYRIQNPTKGFLCMNKVLFGAQMDPPLLCLFRLKLPSPRTYRSLILEGHRFPAPQALQEGLVDALGGLPETLEYVAQRELVKKGEKGVYAGLREEMWKEQVALLKGQGGYGSSAEWAGMVSGRRVSEGRERLERLEGFEKGRGSGSKL